MEHGPGAKGEGVVVTEARQAHPLVLAVEAVKLAAEGGTPPTAAVRQSGLGRTRHATRFSPGSMRGSCNPRPLHLPLLFACLSILANGGLAFEPSVRSPHAEPLSVNVRPHWNSTCCRGAFCKDIPWTIDRLTSHRLSWLVGDSRFASIKSFVQWKGCFGCTGYGRCMKGLCSCPANASGIDCAHSSQVIASTLTNNNDKKFSIYIHDLPPEFSMYSFAVGVTQKHGGDSMYSAEWRFLSQLVNDITRRTLDPAEADLFIVPMFTVFAIGNTGCDRARMLLIKQYLQASSPFWRRCNGCDHVFFMTGDRGACGLEMEGTNAILVTHWGLLGSYDEKMTNFSRGDDDFEGAARLRSELSSGKWCFSPQKDIVIPPFVPRVPPRVTPPKMESTSVFFAGGTWGYMNRQWAGVKRYEYMGMGNLSYYSQGMRQALFGQYGGSSGKQYRMHIVDHSEPDHYFKQAEFCIAPSGGGWGARLYKAILLGCVPLITQPYNVQAFEDILNYGNFSIRLGAVADVLRLRRIIADEQMHIQKLKQGLQVVRKAFDWNDGGLAYNYTVLSLCHRASELNPSLRSTCEEMALTLPGASAVPHMPEWFPKDLQSAIVKLRRIRQKNVTNWVEFGTLLGQSPLVGDAMHK